MNYPSRSSIETRYEFAQNTVAQWVGKRSAFSVFDVGAGSGSMRPRIERCGACYRGFDLAPSSGDVEQWDLSQPLEVAMSCDVVLCLDVLEHCKNPGLALANISGVLPTAGRLVLTVPNPRWSRSRLSALLYGYPTCFSVRDIRDNGHVFTPWPEVVELLLEDARFRIDEYVTLDGRTGLPGLLETLKSPLRLIGRAVCMYIERKDPSAQGMSYGIVATRV